MREGVKEILQGYWLDGSVCHHGILLFHVSLWTPGEQQFYTFTLLSMLLEHLPNSWKVGCLYVMTCTSGSGSRMQWNPTGDDQVSSTHERGSGVKVVSSMTALAHWLPPPSLSGC